MGSGIRNNLFKIAFLKVLNIHTYDKKFLKSYVISPDCKQIEWFLSQRDNDSVAGLLIKCLYVTPHSSLPSKCVNFSAKLFMCTLY